VAELSTVVHSAGGVVWRASPDGAASHRTAAGGALEIRAAAGGAGGAAAAGGAGGALEIALVHRPRYDDWSLPKGKLDPGEHRLVAAVREVFEETGARAVPQVRLPTIRYLTGQPGVEKVVDFWTMRAESCTEREPDDEIEEVRWVPPWSATPLLSYAHDRGVVKAFLELPPVTSVIALVRHAKAGKRGLWAGPDEGRPLDDAGAADARALCRLLLLFRPRAVLSAAPLRCQQTVAPLGLPVVVDPLFNHDSEPAAAAAALRSIAAEGRVAAVSSQGELIPPVLAELTGRANPQFATAKGTGWILSFSGERLIGYDHLTPRG
jgi:8-oxo-dGTP pyrophosphatase MutT (NUDIX family)/phosphohistidine phosphatase SixA